jgi:multiple sugar transport system permease protein
LGSSDETLGRLWSGVDLPGAGRVGKRRSAWGAAIARAAPYAMLAPAALLILALTVYPLLYSVRISLERRTGFAEPEFVGLENFSRLLHDQLFWNALEVTAIFTFAAVTLELGVGFGLALVVAARETRLTRWLRTIYLLPMIVAPIVVGIVWRLLYQADSGAVPYLASLVGLGQPDILGSPGLALPALIAVDVWEWTPFMFLVVLAGLQSLPQEPYEAARVDGAGRIQLFFTLTLPLLRPVLLVALLVRTMDAFTIFDQVFALTRGGPGTSTQVLGLYAYENAFRFSQLGYGAAIVFCMIVLLALVSIVMIRALRRGGATA